MSAPALELEAIDKRFGRVHAVRGAGISIEAGTVHALVGENGAGKSTLMKIAYGHEHADEGVIRIAGQAVDRRRHSPAGAIARKVGMVHQHFMLVPTLTVAENLILGREPTTGGVIDRAAAAAAVRELGARVGMPIDPRARVGDLGVGGKQRVEILRVLYQGAELLILDEPTAVLTPAEVRELFEVLRRLVAGGATCVLVTHKLDEVVDIADRVTVMRRGQVVAELGGDDIEPAAIARAMVGRPVLLDTARTPPSPGEVALSVRGLRASSRGGRGGVLGVDLAVRAGEIVGVAGVEGNGQRELVEAVAGLRPALGQVRIGDRDVSRATVRQRAAAGLAHVPEDRQQRGLVLDFSVEDNLALGREAAAARFGLIDRAAVRARAREHIADYDVRPAAPDAAARVLSGGNQQKLVVARELSAPGLRVLLCAQPTRGVDIGAIELIHRRIIDARDRGVAVLLVSSELSELRALADRVVVMHRGRIVAELATDELDTREGLERVGALMTGAGA